MARRGGRSFRRTKSAMGRQGLWIRQSVFAPDLQQSTTGTFGELIATPVEWERENLTTTQPKEGAGQTRLERIIGSFMVSIEADEDAGFGALFIEYLIWVQGGEFANLISDSASFTTTFQQQRLLAYGVLDMKYANFVDDIAGDKVQFGLQKEVSVKAKARLANKAIGFAIRMNEDINAFQSVTVGFASSVYITTP